MCAVVKCGSGYICNSEVQSSLLTSTLDTPKQDFCIPYAATTSILSTAQILSYNDLLFYIILIFYNFSKHNIKAPCRWCRSTETCRSVCNII